jgi:PIN domain nuclease of toxin-antitoxin system
LILDTTYLLPLLGIRIREDLFSAIVSGRIQLKLKDIRLSSISLFEIQAKAAKLRLPPSKVVRAINTLKKKLRSYILYAA